MEQSVARCLKIENYSVGYVKDGSEVIYPKVVLGDAELVRDHCMEEFECPSDCPVSELIARLESKKVSV